MQNTYSLKEANSLEKSLSLYLTLFVSYIVSGFLLSSISFQSQVVPVWLPAGIALVGCYIWWWRFFPAVFLASFIYDFSVISDFDTSLLFSYKAIENLHVNISETWLFFLKYSSFFKQITLSFFCSSID